MEPLSQATREILWNISNMGLLYVLFIFSLLCFCVGVYRRIQFWKKGKSDDERFSDLLKRFRFAIREVLFQKKVRQSGYPGLFHSLIFYSFLVLFTTTGIIALDYSIGTSFFKGHIYIFLTVASEIAGVLLLIGVLMAFWRRFVHKPETLETAFSDTWALILLVIIIITGFGLEGIRISVAGDKWQAFSPVGYMTSFLFSGVDANSGSALHAALWWTHSFFVLFWIATIPYTKFVHVLTMPANAFFSKIRPPGELDRIDLEALIESPDFNEENFNIGIDTIHDFTWKHRLDFDACVSCGRCEEVCPALIARRPLSPKKFIAGMKDLVLWVEEQGVSLESGTEIVSNAFDTDYVWHCLTCMACTQACPAYIAHVDTLMDIRRNEVAMKGRADADVSRVIKSMEIQGNPFGSQIIRIEWVKSLNVPVLDEGDTCDVLYWIGCLTTFDENKQQIAIDLIHILKKFQIDFRVLGKAETCCGDPARICGDENLFQIIAKGQIEQLNRRSFKTLLVSCPHCYNVLKNEYPQFKGKFHVVHHSEFLQDLLQMKKLKKTEKGGRGKIVYHDPCYLGRYQNIYDSPRQVIKGASGSELVEMKHCREMSRCCGGGGGHFWIGIKKGDRIDTMRVQQVQDAKANSLVTSCPYCFHMLKDALKTLNLEKEICIQDIASLLSASLI